MKTCVTCFAHFHEGDRRKQHCSQKCQDFKRPFRVFDGEGRTVFVRTPRMNLKTWKKKHRMILLACTDGKNREVIRHKHGLSSQQCFAFLTAPRPKAINTWFSFGYDVNKITEDLPLKRERSSRKELWERGVTKWMGWRVSYTPRKIFQVSCPGRQAFHSYDTFGFFQKSFLKVCKDFGISTTSFEIGKEQRANFLTWSLDKIEEYNFHEMEAMLDVLNRLREALYGAQLLPQQWHGPGAIAAVWLKKYEVDQWYSTPPDGMEQAIRHAYFGGRIDIAGVGEYELYRSDLASAYPAGLCHVISQSAITWVNASPERDDDNALYRVVWKCAPGTTWGPFPWRTRKGGVLFPLQGEGWYWGVEVLAAENCFPGSIERVDAWYPIGERYYPLRQPITTDYKKRQEMKRNGNPCELGLKLALNSLYGKMAQHHAKFGKTPRYRNYIWAGFATAYCRAQVLRVLTTVGQGNLVAVATDGIFTRVPVPGSNEEKVLGTWQDEGYGPSLIIAPGLYALYNEEGTPKVYKSRGMPSQLNFGHVLRLWGCTTERNTPGENSFRATRQAFIGMGQALHQNLSSVLDAEGNKTGEHTRIECGEFVTQRRLIKNVTIFGTSKRRPSIEHVATYDWKEFPLESRPRPEGEWFSTPYMYRKELDETIWDE